jgi:uncharacterized small protein (DUF1192 family)
LREERTTLQEEITTLQAEVQRSLSLCRIWKVKSRFFFFLAAQFLHFLTSFESEQVAASLTNELEHVKAQLGRAAKAGTVAEVKLCQMSELQRRLAALQSQPDLSGVIADLEERNNEMGRLLKNKCVEIEENDDRALECVLRPSLILCGL